MPAERKRHRNIVAGIEFTEQVRSDVLHELLLELRNLADALADAVELMHRRSVVEKVVPESHLDINQVGRSEEHTSELQSLMRISYAVFCLKKKKKTQTK